MQEPDIAIVGAGSAGLTLALLLAKTGLQICLLEQGPPPAAKVVDNIAPQGNPQITSQSNPQRPAPQRVSALNPASQRLLQALGVWSELPSALAAPYQQMQVWEADSFARIGFSAGEQRRTELGWIVDNEALRSALYRQLQQYPQVQCRFGVDIKQIQASARQNLLTLSDGTMLIARLLVGADGANSKVRQSLQLPLAFWDYQQDALVATIRCEEPHQATARQVFLPDGPLALLPLSDPYLCSIVWSSTPANAKALLACSETEFNQRLTAAAQSVLGLCSVQSTRVAFPLRMRYASQWLQHKALLVADAAHTIHPLAGQGMNLGLMDVAALAELIEENIEQGLDWTAERQLRRYERWRKAEAQQLIIAMEAFKRGFGAPQQLLKLVRAVGMRLTDKLPLVKDKIIAAALGNSGDLPKIALPDNKAL